jgi:glycosidase
MRKFVTVVLVLVVALVGFTNPTSPSVETASAVTTGRPLPSWAKSASIYEVNIRSFTTAGTFKAFKAHLPRLKKLGVKILWLMPIHPISETKRIGSLGSPYAVANYKQVNPDMGTNADFLSLVKAAHAAGFKVVLDWVANHTGWDNVWMSNPSWYTRNNAGVIQPPNQDWQDVADLNYSNADMRAAMIDAMKYWVTTFGVDGFRCDYANGVPTSFWEEAATQLDTIKPMFMLAESEGVADELNSAFNANYSWSLLSRLNSVANNGDPDASYLTSTLDSLTYTYENGSFPVTFITNHDQNSWNGTEYERLHGFVNRFSALYFTVPGMPLIYSGQEVGFKRRLQFFDKDSITWPKSSSMTTFYTKLVSLKTKNPALWNGSAGGELVQYDGTNAKVLTYSRQKGSSKVVVAINLSSRTAKTTIDTGSAFKGYYYDYSTGKKFKVTSSRMTISVPAGSFVIYSTALVK